jgi:hypothetical protein
MNRQPQTTWRTTGLSIGMAGILPLAGAGAVVPVNAQTSDLSARLVAQSPNPVTYMTPKNANEITVQIKEGEFFYRGILRRTSGNMFISEDSQVRVIYDKGKSHVVVINKKTGTEYYNYIFSTVNEGNL